jgi:hypothetical protein
VITNAHATLILTCDRIASQNSRKISRPYNKKMSWLHDRQQYLSEVRSLKEPIDSKGLKLTSTCPFLLKSDVRGRNSHKHSHFTKVRGKSQRRIRVLVQGENTISSSRMVGKAMHREDVTRDLASRNPGQHDSLLPRVWSPPPPYPQGTGGAPPALKTAANIGAPYSELHLVKCNTLAECPLEFVTSSQDLVQCSLWQH